MFEYIIKNGTVFDGTGVEGKNLDIAIEDGLIVAIGKNLGLAKNVIDATDLIVTPGFFDLHSHGDFLNLMENDLKYSRIWQGITTEIVGQCGLGPVPLDDRTKEGWKDYLKPIIGEISQPWNWHSMQEFIDVFKKKTKIHNQGFLVTHGAIRNCVLGLENIQPNRAQLAEMCQLTKASMEAGAFGISFGIAYLPGVFAHIDELIELAKVVAEYNGVMMIHIRNHSHTIIPAMKEALEIARISHVRLHISHMRSYANRKFGVDPNILINMVEEAIAEGIDVTFDEHASLAGSTLFSQILPPWAKEGGVEDIIERLKNHLIIEKLLVDLSVNGPDYDGWDNYVGIVGWDNILISSVYKEHNAKYQGKTIGEIAMLKGKAPFETAIDLIIDEEAKSGMVMLNMFSEQDIKTLIAHPLCTIGTDGLPSGLPHPRIFRTIPVYLGHYIRDLGILSWQEAIKRLTGDAAKLMQITDRGTIAIAKKADINIINPLNLDTTEDYVNPIQKTNGIEYVFINGILVYHGGRVTNIDAGEITIRK